MARSRAKKAKKYLNHDPILSDVPEESLPNLSSLYINALSLLFLCDVGLVDSSLVKFGALWACGFVGFLWRH